jgi:hypothetical protein
MYWMLWALIVAAAVVTFASGSFTSMAAVVFGFMAFSMLFLGMISVLPVWATHPALPAVEKVKPPIEAEAAPVVAASESYGVLKSA